MLARAGKYSHGRLVNFPEQRRKALAYTSHTYLDHYSSVLFGPREFPLAYLLAVLH